MFSMAAMTSAMPTVGVRRNAPATRVAAAPATAFPAMNGMSSASLGLRSEGASRSRFLRSACRKRKRPRARELGGGRGVELRSAAVPGRPRLSVSASSLRPGVGSQPRARLDRRFVVFRVLGFRRAIISSGTQGVAPVERGPSHPARPRGRARRARRARRAPSSPSRPPRSPPHPTARLTFLPPSTREKSSHQAPVRP